ncbi:MAG: 2-oxoacid:acceptor oxidoreductase subunit alpha [Desulfobacterales bacterium]|nr:2-oxoacid:acceptor oxidoreductase subunit alpha [Desulfobacterales bacterium]
MATDITVKIGGAAGQGIQTVGAILAQACRLGGLQVLAVNDFESRIRGGHSFVQLRISDRPVAAPSRETHLLVAMDDNSVARHGDTLDPRGRILCEASNRETEGRTVFLPFTEMAKGVGGRILANTVAAGAALSLLDAPLDLCRKAVAEHFGKTETGRLEKNLAAVEAGHSAMAAAHAAAWPVPWQSTAPATILMDGARALALGALAGDCRLAAFYPMSPATGIMAHLASLADRFPLAVEQAEDELAAANMMVGAAFAGVRAMTATSGGGFCLMTEALGLAAMTETPVVIVNAQRPGPATGLPTRTGQGDLLFAIHASQDEFPRFVFAPGSPDQAFAVMQRAFELSDKYQVPAIVLVDQYFNDSLFTIGKWKSPESVRHYVVADGDMADPAAYRRFEAVPDGVSPRALPCRGQALVVACSDEHREDGHISETIADRNRMVEKRNAKGPAMMGEMTPPERYGDPDGLMLIGWGSTLGALRESVDLLRADGLTASALHFTDLWPFPADAVKAALEGARIRVMVEQNGSAQLGRLIREQTGIDHHGAVLKTDGRPFYPADIARQAAAMAKSA